jgi:hypothetical protein
MNGITDGVGTPTLSTRLEMSESESNNGGDEPDTENDVEIVEPDESEQLDQPTETQVAGAVEPNPALSAEVEALSTFSEQDGPLRFRILPVIEGGQTDWRLIVYMQGTQGPVYQSREGLTEAALEQFGISVTLQERLNSALQYAKENLEVPDGLGDQKRAKKTLSDLESIMEE